MIQPMQGEEVKKTLKPHPVAFASFYAVFIYLIALGLVFWAYYGELQSRVGELPLLGLFPSVQALYMVWWLLLIVPALAVAVARITWRWLFLFILVGIAASVAQYYYGIQFETSQLVLIVAGAAGIPFTEAYRRGHTFYITDRRIVTELRFIGYKQRELLYSRINDLVLEKGIMGRLLNYGTIIPITASGFGLGEDAASVTVAVGGKIPRGPMVGAGVTGTKTVSVPRGRSSYVLFGIRRPEEARRLISELTQASEEAPYLRKIVSQMDSLLDKSKAEEAPRKPQFCPNCGTPATWVEQYRRYYCNKCQQYV